VVVRDGRRGGTGARKRARSRGEDDLESHDAVSGGCDGRRLAVLWGSERASDGSQEKPYADAHTVPGRPNPTDNSDDHFVNHTGLIMPVPESATQASSTGGAQSAIADAFAAFMAWNIRHKKHSAEW
jgi:hypothetical protein